MNSIKGVLFLKNVDGGMKWVNGNLVNKGKYEGEIENWEPNGMVQYMTMTELRNRSM